MGEKSKSGKKVYLLIGAIVTYLWYNVLVTTNPETGTIFFTGGLLALIAYIIDMTFKSPSKRMYGYVEKGDLPLDAPPETSSPINFMGFKFKPFHFDIFLGLALLYFFFSTTQQYGIQWVGIPKIPGALTLFAQTTSEQAFWTGMVWFAENSISVVMAFTIASLSLGYLIGKKGRGETKSTVMLAVAIGILASAFGMVTLHGAVYGLDMAAQKSVFVFFAIGNAITFWRQNSVTFGIMHMGYNYLIIATSLNVVYGFTLVGV